MKVVVTGGSGFLGGWLCDLLCEDGAVAEVVNFDLREPPYPPESGKYRFRRGDTRMRHDVMLGLAGANEVYDFASLLGTEELFDLIEAAAETNIMGGLNVLEACRAHGVARVCWPSKVNEWTNVYTATKVAMEQFVEIYRKHHGMAICVLRPWNVYGSRQKLMPVRKFFPVLAAQAILGEPMTVYGSGLQLGNVVYVEDAAGAAIAACRSGTEGYATPAHISGDSMPVMEIVESIRAEAGSRSEIVHLPMREGEEENSRLMPHTLEPKATDLLEERTPWAEGCQRTLEWYRALGDEALRKAVEFHAAS